MINRILLFLSIIFMINVVMVGLGIYDVGVLELDQYNVINKDVSDIEDLSTATSVELVDIGESEGITDSESELSLIPDVSEAYQSLKTISKLAGGLVFGWTMLFVIIGLPAVLSIGLISIIGIIQIFSIFYLISYFIASLRGGI